MQTEFPALSPHFVGREDYINRFRARLEHFHFFLYEGISGIGKTTLILRLAHEAKRIALKGSLYLAIFPGETVQSILTRLECRLLGQSRTDVSHTGDPYTRLIDLLSGQQLVLLLDGLENLKREDLPTLVRLFHRSRGSTFRVIGSIKGDPELSAMDKSTLHLERLRAFSVPEAMAFAKNFPIPAESLLRFEEDVNRGGALAHPLVCRYVLALAGNAIPEKAFLDTQVARSSQAFRLFMHHLSHKIDKPLRNTLATLYRIGMPLRRAVVEEILGQPAKDALTHGLIETVQDWVYIHPLVGQCMGDGDVLSGPQAQVVAKNLRETAHLLGDTVAAIRAAEVLAHAGFTEEAVESLAQSWSWSRDPSFIDAYLKTLSQLPVGENFAPRLKLLSAQVRARQGNPGQIVHYLEGLQGDKDLWTRRRALVALVHTQFELRHYRQVLDAYQGFMQTQPSVEEMMPVAVVAIESLLQLHQLQEASAHCQELLLLVHEQQGYKAQIHLILGRIYTQKGQLTEAVEHALVAAASYLQLNDSYHVALVYSFIGDRYREAGEFEQSRQAYQQFLQHAQLWGDRNLILMAELADAWVALDIGDVAYAQKRVSQVQKNLGPAPSKTLKRQLAAATALLEISKGNHEKAAMLLSRVLEQWEGGATDRVGSLLRAQMIRALIASDKIDTAEYALKKALQGLQGEQQGFERGSLLRESALIKLRRGDAVKALQELNEARRLFAEGGNRREEALTLYRIAHASLDEGNLALANETAKQALQLADEIKHERVQALTHELIARLLLLTGKSREASKHGKEALQTLRRLGDQFGCLHVSETLIRIYLHTGDLSQVLRLGRMVRDQAKASDLIDIYVRSVAFTGIALLRQKRLPLAKRCFRALSKEGFSPWTRALMARFGEALALAEQKVKEAYNHRLRWIKALRTIHKSKRSVAIKTLGQLSLAPNDWSFCKSPKGSFWLSTEELALLRPKNYQLFMDVLGRRLFDQGKAIKVQHAAYLKVLMRIAIAAPLAVPYEQIFALLNKPIKDAHQANKQKTVLKEFDKIMKQSSYLKLKDSGEGLRLVPPEHVLIVVPVWYTQHFDDAQKAILKQLRRLGIASLQQLMVACSFNKNQCRKAVQFLIQEKLVVLMRDGRGQAYRLLG